MILRVSVAVASGASDEMPQSKSVLLHAQLCRLNLIHTVHLQIIINNNK